MVSLTAKDCSVMISMQRVERLPNSLEEDAFSSDELMASSSSDDDFGELPSPTSICSNEDLRNHDRAVIMDDKTGLSFAVSVAITDLDPKVPSSFSDLERKWREKDYLMVSAFKATEKVSGRYLIA